MLHCTAQKSVDLVTFTEEIRNGKLHFLRSVGQKSITIFRKSKHAHVLRYSSYVVVVDSSLDRKSNPKVRSSRQQMFYKAGVTKNFAKLTGKRRCWSLFSIILQAFMPGVFL